jgi:preprotein translocase subunit SecD
MNKFSISQYLLILFVLVLGFTYALPNLYPTQPSIQVAYTDSGKSADQLLISELKNTLENESVDYEDLFLRDGKIVIKFKNLDQQLESKTLIKINF